MSLYFVNVENLFVSVILKFGQCSFDLYQKCVYEYLNAGDFAVHLVNFISHLVIFLNMIQFNFELRHMTNFRCIQEGTELPLSLSLQVLHLNYNASYSSASCNSY